MSHLPLPVRIAAGLVATAVEQARELPRTVVELPLTAVSQALQVSMRAQQKVTELAIKGDKLLGSLRPVEEKPSWATFDDEEPSDRAGAVTDLRPARRPAREARSDASAPAGTTPEPSAPADTAPAVAAETTAAAASGRTAGTGEDRSQPEGDESGPNVMPGYANLTIPQLRGRLRFLSVDELRTLLDWEQAHGNRPAYVTMLSNRITTVTEG